MLIRVPSLNGRNVFVFSHVIGQSSNSGNDGPARRHRARRRAEEGGSRKHDRVRRRPGGPDSGGFSTAPDPRGMDFNSPATSGFNLNAGTFGGATIDVDGKQVSMDFLAAFEKSKQDAKARGYQMAKNQHATKQNGIASSYYIAKAPDATKEDIETFAKACQRAGLGLFDVLSMGSILGKSTAKGFNLPGDFLANNLNNGVQNALTAVDAGLALNGHLGLVARTGGTLTTSINVASKVAGKGTFYAGVAFAGYGAATGVVTISQDVALSCALGLTTSIHDAPKLGDEINNFKQQ